jgi:hypothetical protein
VQKDRIEASVWAFGRGKESWLVEHRVLMGDTARDAVWKRLAEMLGETWTHASGAAMPLARFALDTGFATQEAYAFVRPAAMPRDGGQGCARGLPDRHADRRRCLAGRQEAAPGIKVYSVAVGIAKLEFYNNLRKSADVGEDGIQTTYPVGFVHLPKIDAEFIQQLCAEQLITRRDRNGFPCGSGKRCASATKRSTATSTPALPHRAPDWIASRTGTGESWNGNGLDPPEEDHDLIADEATENGGLVASGANKTNRPVRRVIRSRWIS